MFGWLPSGGFGGGIGEGGGVGEIGEGVGDLGVGGCVGTKLPEILSFPKTIVG